MKQGRKDCHRLLTGYTFTRLHVLRWVMNEFDKRMHKMDDKILLKEYICYQTQELHSEHLTYPNDLKPILSQHA